MDKCYIVSDIIKNIVYVEKIVHYYIYLINLLDYVR